MPLFGGKGPAEVLDRELEAVLVSSPGKAREMAVKCLAKNQAGIRSSLEPGEKPLCIARYMGSMGGDRMLVVTDRRSADFKKGSVAQQLRHGDVAETTLASMSNGDTLLQIESNASRLDYRPNDPMRFEKIIQVQIGTPREAQAICAAIDRFL